MAVRIITDSASDITQKKAAELGIQVLPLTILFGEEEYVDGVTITSTVFYEKLQQAKNLPTTSQVNPEQFSAVVTEALAAGDEVLIITISSKLSGTYQSAKMVEDAVSNENLHIIDSTTVAMGQAILVEEAVAMRDNGATAGEIAGYIESIKNDTLIYAAIHDLKYLYMGGRLSGTARIAGTVLNVKPIVTVQDGLVQVVTKVRGDGAANAEVLTLAKKAGIDLSKRIRFGYTKTAEKSDMLKADFAATFSVDTSAYEISEIGPTVGTHVGPGCHGIAFVRKAQK